jgi:hypothetical protein
MRRAASVQLPAVKLPWHKRSLPADWTPEEVQSFRNWSRELASLNNTLTSAATDHAKLPRKASHIYFKLAYRLTEQIRETATQARGNAVKAARAMNTNTVTTTRA